MKVLRSGDAWFGVTYREDHARVVESVGRLIEQGTYPRQAVAMIDLLSLVAVTRVFEVQGRFRSANPYGSGHIHDTYCVTLDDGDREERIILQRINTAIFTNPIAVMENIERVTEHLRSQVADGVDADRRVLRLVPARSGAMWHVDAEGRYWRAYWFIDGAHSFDAVNSTRQAFEAARAFGEFQRRLADLPGPRLHESISGLPRHGQRFAAFEQSGRGRCSWALRDGAG